MNISIDMVVLSIGAVVSVGGFVISAAILYRGNKNSFKSLKDHFDAGIKQLEISINGKIELINQAQKNTETDIDGINASISGIKDQFRAEIYPRLNAVEKLSEKNCKVQEMHMKECDRRHAV